MEEQARTIAAGQTFGALLNRIKGVIDVMTSNNPYLSHAIASQLALFYDEGLRQSLSVQRHEQPTEGTEAPKDQAEDSNEDSSADTAITEAGEAMSAANV